MNGKFATLARALVTAPSEETFRDAQRRHTYQRRLAIAAKLVELCNKGVLNEQMTLLQIIEVLSNEPA